MDPLNLYLGFTNVCRLCLSQDRLLMKIFPESVEEKGVLFSISSKILACVGIQVLADDNLPDKICEMCLKEIDNWTQFKQICDNANTLLLQSVAGLSPLQNQILQNNLRGCHEENLESLITPSVFDERLALEAESFFQKIDEKHLPSLLSADSLSSVFIDGDNVDQNETITLYSGDTETSVVQRPTSCSKKVIQGNETLVGGIHLDLKEGLIIKEPEVGMEDIMVVTEPDEPDIYMEDIIVKLEQPIHYEHLRNPSREPMHVDVKVDVLQETDINLDMLKEDVENVPISLLDRHGIRGKNLSEESSELNKQHTVVQLTDEIGFHLEDLSDKILEGRTENREENLKQLLEIQRETYLEKYHKFYKRKYDCGFCPRVFSKFTNLLKHDKIEHADVIAQDKCQICGTCFISEGRLLFHSFRHREKKFQCVHCNFYSVCKKSLAAHIQYTHLKEYALPPCHICGRRYRSKSNLLNHIKLHDSTKHSCHICGSKFSQSQALNRHYQTRHSVQKKFECDICLKPFKTLSYVNVHKKNHHPTNPTVCDICGLHYKNQNTLSIHKKTHEERIHSCNICSKMFTTKNLLNRHMNIHNSSRFYICVICDKMFKRHDILKEHLFTHADVQKTFKCEDCNETFRLKRYLRAHTNSLHKKER